MQHQRSPVRDVVQQQDEELGPVEADLSGNQAILDSLGGGEPDEPPSLLDELGRGGGGGAGVPADGADGADDGDLPFRGEMEAAFGEDFGGVAVSTGASELGAIGAHAVASGESVAFARANPDKRTVAHELVHVVQARRGGSAAPRARAAVSAGSDAAEVEAEAVSARVAGGGDAGSIGAAPAAAVHRDAKAAVPAPAVKELGGQKFTVYPDVVYAALTMLGPIPGALSQSAYQAKVDAAGLELVNALVAIEDLDAVTKYKEGDAQYAKLLGAAPADVRAAAMRALASHPRALADVSLAQQLAARLDPKTELRAILDSSVSVEDKIGRIGAWGARFGAEQCKRALADGDIEVRLNTALGRGPSVEARLLLIGAGTIDQADPANRMWVAMYGKDASGFSSAWAEVKASKPQLAAMYLADPGFHHDVHDWVPDAEAGVLKDLTTFRPPGAEPVGVDALNQQGLDTKLAGIAGPIAQQITSSLSTSGVAAAVGGDASHADPAFAQAATQVLAFRRNVVAGEALDLSTEAGRAAAIQVEKQGLEWLRRQLDLPSLLAFGTARGREPFVRAIETADYEVGKRVLTESGATDLSAEEQAAVRAIAERVAGAIAAIDEDDMDAPKQAQALIERYGAEVAPVLGAAGTDPKAQWVARERNRRADDLLDAVFRAKTGRSVESWLRTAGMGAWSGGIEAERWEDRRRQTDIEDDPAAYSELLTPLDLKRLRGPFADHAGTIGPAVRAAGKTLVPGASAPTGTKVEASVMQAKLYLDRGFVAADLAELRSEIARLLEPAGRRDGPALAAWDRKVARAMDAFQTEIDGSYGSLRKALQDGRGDESDQDQGLVLLGDKVDPTAAMREQALVGVQGDASAAHAFLKSAGSEVDAIARRLGSELAPTLAPPPPPPRTWQEEAGRMYLEASGNTVQDRVSDAVVLELAKLFSMFASRYAAAVPGSTTADATRLLTAAFAPYGGALGPPIAMGLTPENADRALSMFGVTYRGIGGTQTADLAQVESGKGGAPRQEGDEQFVSRLESRAVAFSRKLASLTGDPGNPTRAARILSLQQEAGTLVGLARLAEGGDQRLQKLWVARVGIELSVDLGRHLAGDAERAMFGALFAVTVPDLSTYKQPEDVALITGVTKGIDPADPYAFLRRCGVTPDQVDPEFDEFAARTRAVRLHDAIGRLPGSARDVMDIVRGRRAEMTVVSVLFRQIYGYDPMYRLREVFPDDAGKVEEWAALVSTGGSGSAGFDLVRYARTEDRKEVVLRVLRMPQSQRNAVLGNGAALGELRTFLGQDTYDKVVRALQGANLYDVIHDDVDLSKNVEAWFDGRRATLTQDPALIARANGDPKALDALVSEQLQQEGRTAFADPSVRKVVDGFSDRKGFEVQARLLGGGKLDDRAKANKAVIGDGTDESEMHDAVGGMSDEQRGIARTDAFFLRRMASDLEEQDSDIKDSRKFFSELYSDEGKDGMAKLEGARNLSLKAWATDDYDNSKALDAVYKMSREELDQLRSDPVALQRLRASLGRDVGAGFYRLTPERVKAFDDYLAKTATLGTSGAKQGEFLVEQYVARYLKSYDSNKNVLAITQDLYNEKQEDKEKGYKFDMVARAVVHARIVGQLDVDATTMTAVTQCLLANKDPVAERLHYAFDGSDNQTEILAAIDAAGVEQAISWSNVLEKGPTAEGVPLKEKFDAFRAVRDRYVTSKESGAADTRLEEEFLAARNRFWDHRLDLSAGAMDYFSGGGGDMKYVYQFAGGNTKWAQAKDEPSKKRLLEMKDHVRRRILRLTNEEVGPKMGVAAPPELAKDATDDQKHEHEKRAQFYRMDQADLMSADRITRSESVQRDDVYAHERGDGSSDAVETEGSRVDIAYDLYKNEMNRDLGDGKLSPDEIARVKQAGGDFDRKVQEFKEAKAKLASILSFIAKALITAIAIALTGPGGMGLLATLLVAGTTAMADNVINSVVLGNDFDWEEDGTKHLLKELGTAAFTFGVGKAFNAVAAPLGIAGAVNKVKAFEERLAAGAGSSFPGMLANYAYQSGKSIVTSPLQAVSEAAIDMIDPSEWKYGMADYSTFARETFDAHMDQLGGDLKGQLLENLAEALVTRGKGMLGGKKPGELPGISTPTPRDQSIGARVKKYAGDGLAGLTEEGLKVLARKVAADEGEGLSVGEDEAYEWLMHASGRAMKAAGTAIGAKRNASAVQRKIDASRGVIAEGSEEEAHYRAHLEGSTSKAFGGVQEDPAAFAQKLAAKRAEVRARATGPLAEQYERWVFGDPATLEQRLHFDYADFEAKYQAGTARLQQIRGTDAYKQLSREEKWLYDEAANSESGRLGLSARGGILAIDTAKGLESFKAGARHHVETTVAENAAEATAGWDDAKRAAFAEHLKTLATDDLGAASMQDPQGGGKKRAKSIAERWGAKYDADGEASPRGKRVDLGGDEASFAGLGGDEPAQPTARKPKEETWEIPRKRAEDPDLAARQQDIEARVARIRAEHPHLTERDAHRMARNEAIYAVADEELDATAQGIRLAAANGDHAALTEHLRSIRDPSRRRAVDLALKRSGTSLDAAIAALPVDEAQKARTHVGGLRASDEQVAKAQFLIDQVEEAREAMNRGDPGAKERYARLRDEATRVMVDVYGIDDSGARMADRGATTGLQPDRSGIGSPDYKTGGDALARPEGVVLVDERLFGARDDGTFVKRSPGLVAAAIAHEAEVHLKQVNEGRMGAPLTAAQRKAGAPDSGTAVNEVEAYAFMIRNASRFGLTEEELEPVRRGLEEHLRILRAQTQHDPVSADGPLPEGMDPVVGAALRDLVAKEPRKPGALGDGVFDESKLGHETSDPAALGRVAQGDFTLRTKAEPRPDPDGTMAAGPVKASRNNPVLDAIADDVTGAGKHVKLGPVDPKAALASRHVSEADAGKQLGELHTAAGSAKDPAQKQQHMTDLVSWAERQGLIPGRDHEFFVADHERQIAEAKARIARAQGLVDGEKANLERTAKSRRGDAEAALARAEAEYARVKADQDAVIEGHQTTLRQLQEGMDSRRRAVVGKDPALQQALEAAEKEKAAERARFAKYAVGPLKGKVDLYSIRSELYENGQTIDNRGRRVALEAAPDRTAKNHGGELRADGVSGAEATAALRERASARKAGDGAAMNRASEVLGEQAADRFAEEKGWKKAKLDPAVVETDGAHSFDRIYDDGRGGFVIVEAKGGTSQLGTRKTKDGVVAQQGSRAYVEDVIKAIRAREKPPHPNSEALRTALESGKLEVYIVRQEIGDDGRIGQRSLQQVDMEKHYDRAGDEVKP